VGDKRKNNGGARKNSGRKSKAEELGIREKLQPMERDFLDALQNQIQAENMAALKIYAEYFYGKPQEKVDITTDGKAISITLDLK
jgi:hypothetical protein